MKRIFSSLKLKFMFFLFVMCGLAFFVHYFFLIPAIEEMELREHVEFQGQFTQHLQSHLEGSLKKTVKELEAIAVLIQDTGFDRENLDRILGEMDAVSPFFNYYFVVDPKGYWLSRPSSPESVGKRLTNSYWVDEVLARNATSFLDVHQAKTTKQLVSGFVAILRDKTDRVFGLLRGVYLISDENTILRQVMDLRLGKGGYAYIVDSNGRLVAHPEISLRYENFALYDFKDLPPVKKALAGESGYVEYEYDGEIWIASYSPIPTTGWAIVVQQPKKEMLALSDRQAVVVGKIIIFSFLALTLLMALLSHYALKPLTKLGDAIREGTPCRPEDFPNDEIGLLASKINTYRLNLEGLVNKRTRELKKANQELLVEITEHQKAKNVLQESEQKYRSFVENFSGIAFRSDLSYNPIFFQGDVVEITGYSEADFLSGNPRWDQIILPEDLENLPGRDQLKTSKDYFCSRQYRIFHRNGEIRWVSDRVQNVCDEKGKIVWVQGIIYDITRQKKEEQEQAHLEKKLLHVQKLESLGVLAGGIAHDFNNLLMVILGHTELIKIKIPPESPALANLQAIMTSTRRAADLCGQMLAYSGRGHFVTKSLNLNDLVQEMTHMLEVSISKKASLKFRLDDNLPAFNADVTQIRQILMNLIVNASEAIGDENGTISISTGVIECDADYLAKTFSDEKLTAGTFVYLEVADTGVGMDEETKARLFDPFYTTKFTGRGLGLSAVLGIIRGHHGGIIVDSEKGKGTCFKLLFPVSSEVGDPASEGREDNNGNWRWQGTVLLVDDEESVLNVAKEMIEHLGFTVLTAVDGLEALKIFRQQSDSIDCVVLDLTMPNMDGEQAYLEMCKVKPDVQVIIASGYNDQEVSRNFSEKKIAGFIKKPYEMKILSARLRKVFGQGTPG